MATKKILHFITDTDIGGTELMLVRLLPHLKQSFDTRVVCAMSRGQAGTLLEEHGIPVTYLNFRHWLDLGIIYRFYRVVRNFRPDILVTHLIHPDLFGRVFGRLFGIRAIVCSQQGSLLQWEWLRKIDRLTAPLVDVYIVQTEVARDELVQRLRLPRRRFIVIPNSVLPHRATTDRSAVTEALGVPQDDLKIICVSRLRRRKGHEYLLAAFEQLLRDTTHVSLLLVGDGERQAALEEQANRGAARSKIFFLGNRSDVGDLLAASDIFVLPTLAEGMSNAILEAMAAGLPCIVSNIEVNKALITPNETGLFFQAGDVHDLAAKLRLLINKPLLRRQLGQRAQTDVARQFNPLHIGNEWVRLLTRLT